MPRKKKVVVETPVWSEQVPEKEGGPPWWLIIPLAIAAIVVVFMFVTDNLADCSKYRDLLMNHGIDPREAEEHKPTLQSLKLDLARLKDETEQEGYRTRERLELLENFRNMWTNHGGVAKVDFGYYLTVDGALLYDACYPNYNTCIGKMKDLSQTGQAAMTVKDFDTLRR